MAVGPFARILAQIVVPVVAVLARAIPAAYGQALQNARKAGVDAATSEAASATVFGKRISRSEALQVLNLTEKEATPEAIEKVGKDYYFSDAATPHTNGTILNPISFFLFKMKQQFDRFFAANDVSKGGSFYLQSKVYRAKELLLEFQNEKKMEEQAQRKQQQQQQSSSNKQ
eukprot:scaffold15772_cov162-Cylindrotheca_fusiformis.AAC.6